MPNNTPIPAASTSGSFGSFICRQRAMSLDVAIQAGVQGIAQTALQYHQMLLLYELKLRAGETEQVDPQTGGIVLIRRDVGVNLLVKIRNIEADIEFDFKTVSAAAQAQLAETTLEIATVGQYPTYGALGGALPLNILQQKGGLGKVTAHVDAIKQDLIANANSLAPSTSHTFLGFRATEDTDKARSVLFAARRIAKGCSLEESFASISGAKLDPSVVRNTYFHVMGYRSDAEKPSLAHQELARKTWLKF
jgi:hypothetical protein